MGGGEFIYTVPDPPTEELRARLVKVLPKDAQIPSEHRLLAGDPADCIVKLAEDENVDFIVMGTHGRRGLTRILMGSVAELVVRWAKCPVVTVKAPKKYYQVGQKQRPLRGSSIRLLSSRTIHVGQLFLIMNSAL